MSIKKLILGIIVCLVVTSCRTIKIDEKSAFAEAKYNYGQYIKAIDQTELNQTEKESFKKIINSLVNTNEEKLYSDDELKVNRSFHRTNDSTNLEYIQFVPKKYDKVGFFFLGNGSNILTIWKELSKIAISSKSKIYVLNYRGYGKSEGLPSFKSVFDDNQNFLNLIQKNEKINFTIGYSLGSVSATYLARDNRIEKLVLMAPLSNAKDVFKYMKHQKTKGLKFLVRPLFKLTAEDYLLKISNTNKIKNYSGDFMVLHGTADKSLPYSMGKNLYQNSASKKKKLITIKGGGHGAPFEEEYLKQIILFIM